MLLRNKIYGCLCSRNSYTFRRGAMNVTWKTIWTESCANSGIVHMLFLQDYVFAQRFSIIAITEVSNKAKL